VLSLKRACCPFALFPTDLACLLIRPCCTAQVRTLSFAFERQLSFTFARSCSSLFVLVDCLLSCRSHSHKKMTRRKPSATLRRRSCPAFRIETSGRCCRHFRPNLVRQTHVETSRRRSNTASILVLSLSLSPQSTSYKLRSDTTNTRTRPNSQIPREDEPNRRKRQQTFFQNTFCGLCLCL
jgi:hypothetical protein